jgi:hypothetical protein
MALERTDIGREERREEKRRREEDEDERVDGSGRCGGRRWRGNEV